ncbi:MAG: MATE family efflux transporter [Gemmatimonadota bacterium]
MQIIPDRAEMRELLNLAIPIVSVQVGLMFMGVVDTIMVGHISAVALAAVALGNLFYFALGIFGIGVLLSLDPIIAQAVGARDDIGIARGMQRGFLIALALTIFMSAALPFAGTILGFLNQPEEVVPIAATYVLTVMPSTLPLLAFTVLRQGLQAMGRVAPIVWTIMGANLLNAALNWILIFGELGAPELGVVGAALATTIARWALFFALLWVSWPLLHEYLRPRRDAFALKPVLRMFKLGLPIGVSHFVEYANFAGIALLMGFLGTYEMAAHQVAINIASLTFMVPAGIGAAASVLVGNAIGRGDAEGARRSGHAALVAGAAFMSVSALVMLAIPELLATVYTNVDAVIVIAVVLLPIAGVFQVFDGLQVVGAGVLRGAGDTRVPMLIGLLGFWLIGFPISVYLGFFTDARAAGLWWGFVAGLAAVAIFLLLRIRWRFRGELSRIVVDEHVVEWR